MGSVAYRGRESFLARRDPRVLILVPAFTVISVIQIGDVRLMAAALALALTYYFAAQIPLREVSTNWAVVAFFVVCVAGVNGVIVGANQYGLQATPLFNLPLFGSVVSTASLSYALTVFVRFAAIAATSFPLAFVIRPGDLAVTLARLGVPGQLAYGVELAFRLLPSISETIRETVAAQRLRGYEPGRSYNPIVRVRHAQPLIIAATVGVFTDAEDTIDALDLRCFGTQRRTWLRTLRFDLPDVITISTAFGAATAATIANVCGGMPPLYLMF